MILLQLIQFFGCHCHKRCEKILMMLSRIMTSSLTTISTLSYHRNEFNSQIRLCYHKSTWIFSLNNPTRDKRDQIAPIGNDSQKHLKYSMLFNRVIININSYCWYVIYLTFHSFILNDPLIFIIANFNVFVIAKYIQLKLVWILLIIRYLEGDLFFVIGIRFGKD